MQGRRPAMAPQWARSWLQGLLSQKVGSAAEMPKASGRQWHQRIAMCSTFDACTVSVLRISPRNRAELSKSG